MWGQRKKPAAVEKAKPIQVNPIHADKIVRQIIAKHNWHGKIDRMDIVKKWEKESMDSGISKSSFLVAMDILKDIKELSHTQKSCCGHCGATPKKRAYTDHNSDNDVDENETLFETAKKRDKPASDLEEPKKKKKSEDDDENDEDDEDDEAYYWRSTKFCLCPCAHCAFEEKQVGLNICHQQEDLIPKELAERVKKQFSELVENIPEDKYDWHPGSNQQVLDIIHPSLYCYSKKHSKFNGKFEDAKQLEKQMETAKVETQWLPTDFEIQENGKVKPLSYINNVDPKSQKELQETICDVLSRFIEPVKQFIPKLNEKKVQVIIKAANVIVTPEQGFYPGGTWHTEGDSENILATGIYYYECENVKESVLEFRASLDEENFYDIEQDGVEQAWNEYGVSIIISLDNNKYFYRFMTVIFCLNIWVV
ncbi:predicted protein [Naegleria gruberi]|uniref:Predicted protein n=1 Tax=Naegleria gruberi TaxID=5762 RepID=D2VJE3_NAEGR|nr:uncharacterized protein NAEGRDRAFT_69008 [Naegleria gruberi]EFC42928.1 predicted protein [Naegleria gruberi]|eukprot:XP_002675672.1 predicted protein [Naegleria gruberi strain NEG-M]